MIMKPGLSSEKIPGRERAAALFATEKKLHIFVFAIVVICQEIFWLINKEDYQFNRGAFVFAFIFFFFLFAVLEYVFYHLVESSWGPFFSIVPAVLLYGLLKVNNDWNYLAKAVLIAMIARIIFDYLPAREQVIKYGCILLDIIAIFLRIYWGSFGGEAIIDKLLFIALVVLTFSTLQQIIWGRKKGYYPFYYFMLLGIVLLLIPMKQEPLDWSKLEGAFGNAADATAYYLSSVIGNSGYTVGYGSLKVTGGNVSHSDKLQLVLESVEKPYFVYTDPETDKKMKMRRTLYLSGGRGVDGQALVEWIQFLYDNQVSKEDAAVFSQVSKIEVEYVYLDTADEIAPANAIFLTNQDGTIQEGKSGTRHKKGYKLKAKYLDIDYGSPQLISMFKNPRGSLIDRDRLTYKQASDYYLELYNQSLSDVMDAEEYAKYVEARDANSYYGDTNGITGRMKKLASEITAGAENDYDKAKAIESYLRQYTYSTTSVGGHNPDSDMSTTEGMADIADRFLFETEKGYCVHYTSAMISLLKAAGIPARPANGFRFSFPFEVQEKYVVEADCAHVWPEAYIRDVGWIPFEPTSAYNTASDYTWHRKSSKEAEAEIIKQAQADSALPEIPEPVKAEEDINQNSSLQIVKIVGIVLLSIVLLILLIIALAEVIRRIRYRLATPEQKIKIDVNMIKDTLIRQSQNTIKDRGLLSDYIEAAPEELRVDIRRSFQLYYKVIYGNLDIHPISQEETILTKQVRDSLKAKKQNKKYGG